jgi:hypothetical protein
MNLIEAGKQMLNAGIPGVMLWASAMTVRPLWCIAV